MLKTKTKISIAKKIHKLLLFIGFKNENIVRRNSVNWKLNLSEGIDLSIFILGSFQGKVVKSIVKIIRNLNEKQNNFFTIIDVGSNIGDKSLSISSKLINLGIKNFKIFSIEPTDYAFRKQKINISLNKNLKKKISLFKYFISNKKNKPKKTYSSWKLNSNQNTHKIHNGTLKEINNLTKNISLDNFIKKMNIRGETIIKIDVDGFEMNILKSSKNFLKKNTPIIFMEYANYALEEHGSSYNEFIKFIKKYNYKIYDLNLRKLNKIGSLYGSSRDIILIKGDRFNLYRHH